MTRAQARAKALQLVRMLNRRSSTAHSTVDAFIRNDWDAAKILAAVQVGLSSSSPQDQIDALQLWLPFATTEVRRHLSRVILKRFFSVRERRIARPLLTPKRKISDEGLKLLAEILRADRMEYLTPIRACARPACGEYFLRGRQDQIFHARSCASRVSAARSVRKHRAEQRALRIESLKKAIDAYDCLPRKPPDWKRWVAERAGLGITKKWITRNRRELFPEEPWEPGI